MDPGDSGIFLYAGSVTNEGRMYSCSSSKKEKKDIDDRIELKRRSFILRKEIMHRKGSRIMKLLLGSVLLFGLFGCKDKNDEVIEEPLDGENIRKEDPDAPKTIESSDIASADIAVYIAERYYGDENHDFHFQIYEENGEMVISELNSGVKDAADEKLLSKIQQVVEENDLVRYNGVYDVTAGIAPEYQARRFLLTYKSGEKIEFTMDNNPYAIWSEKLYDAIADHLAEKGNTALYPEEDDSLMNRFRLSFEEDGKETEFSDIYISDKKSENGKKLVLQYSVYDTVKGRQLKEKYIEFPESYFEDLTKIIAKTDVRRRYNFSRYDHKADNYGNHEDGYFGLGDKTTFDEEEDSKTLSLDLYMVYESGERYSIETRKESEIEGIRPLIEELINYHRSLFK